MVLWESICEVFALECKELGNFASIRGMASRCSLLHRHAHVLCLDCKAHDFSPSFCGLTALWLSGLLVVVVVVY